MIHCHDVFMPQSGFACWRAVPTQIVKSQICTYFLFGQLYFDVLALGL